jgi:pimeloyl-[acyl-carrier protein] synthase
MGLQAAAALDFTKIAELGNGILPRLNAIREEEPIAWSDTANGWLVTRHQDVMDGFLGKVPLSCIRMETRSIGNAEAVKQFAARYPLMVNSLPNWIVNSDPPRHTRLRMLMTRAFSRRVVDDLRPFAHETIASVLDGLAGRRDVDFMEDIARPITGRVIMKKFGLHERELSRLKNWSVAFNTGLGGVIAPSAEVMDSVERSIAEMQEVFLPEIAKRRAQPSDDFLSQLVLARDGEDRLSEDEMLGICYLVIVAGHDTTMNTMTLGVAALSKAPEARRQLLERPDNILDSVMEVMRYVAMATAFNRIAAEDFEWHGQKIRKGDIVWLMTAAANRDPRMFPDPDTIDLARAGNDRTTVFGSGIHHCIGHLLAKMQLCEFFPEFFRRFPNAEVTDEQLDFLPSLSFRGLSHLKMRLS